jgi:hypothetical protein
MHPILARRERLSAYLAAWLPLAAMLAYLLAVSSPLTWVEAAGLAVPLARVGVERVRHGEDDVRAAPPRLHDDAASADERRDASRAATSRAWR